MTYREPLMDKLQRKFGRYAIRNLMLYIVAGMALVYVLDMIAAPMMGFSLSHLLMFNRSAILRGQIWRLFTFIFIPPSSSMLFIVFALYFDYLVGTALQQQWGSFRFNLYYLCGMLGTIISGLLTGYATNSYLNMSLFFAFALLYPDYELMLLILPVKVKYLALLSAVGVVYSLIVDSWAGKLALIVSLINVALFFWRDAVSNVKNAYRRYQWKKNWRR